MEMIQKSLMQRFLVHLTSMLYLDRTSFYARGGGQEPDHGTIAGFEVVDVNKHGEYCS